MLALIDGDILTHRIGFGLRKEKYPENFYKYNVDKFIGRILTELRTGDYKIFLSGHTNFRFGICNNWSFLHYKGNREKFSRPPMYNEIRVYLKEVYNAEEAINMEADDCLGIAQCQAAIHSTCICSDDKDMLMIPGQHLNVRTWEKITVSKEDAWRRFYCQVLTGDWGTDNIPGLRGVGIKTAQKILKDCKTTIEMDQRVLKEYRKRVDYRGMDTMPGIALNSGYHHMSMNNWDKGGIDSLVEDLMGLIWIKRGDEFEDENYCDQKELKEWTDKAYGEIGC